MTIVLLTKISGLYPELRRHIEIYQASRSQTAKHAIANSVLRRDTSQLAESEVLYLAWIKADGDQSARESSERLRSRIAAKLPTKKKG